MGVWGAYVKVYACAHVYDYVCLHCIVIWGMYLDGNTCAHEDAYAQFTGVSRWRKVCI